MEIKTCNMHTKKHSTIEGRSIWLYHLEAPIGDIYIVEFEDEEKCLNRSIIDGDPAAADKKYLGILKNMATGKM